MALVGACETPAPASPGPTASAAPTGSPSPISPSRVSVAFIQDLSPEGALERALPVLHAIQLAFATAALQAGAAVEVEVVTFDAGDSSGVAEEIAGDEAVVAAIASPDLGGQAEIASVLGVSGVPLISLSGRGSVTGEPDGTWLRLVAPLRAQAEALADAAASLRAARRGVCVAATPADGTVYAKTIRRSLPPETATTDVEGAAEAIQAGCGVVVWPGGAEGGAELAVALSSAPDAPVVLGGASLRDPQFLELAGEAAEGAVALCSCAEVSTSLDLSAQRFIQDYQSEFGSPPGPYAVEAWDASHLLARAVREAGPDRADLVAWLAGTTSVEGLGGPYVLEGGELADARAAIRVSSVEGGRWVPAGG